MTDPFLPFIKVSQAQLAAVLPELKASDALVYLYFITHMDEENLVAATYEDIKAGTSIDSSSTIADCVRRLDTVKLAMPTGNASDGRKTLYKVNDRYAIRRKPSKNGLSPDFGLVEQIDRSICLDSGSSVVDVVVAVEQIDRLPFEEDVPYAGMYQGFTAFQVYESEKYGELTPSVGYWLGDLIDDFGEWQVIKALCVGSHNQVRKQRYVTKILTNWRDGKPQPAGSPDWPEVMS